MRVLPGRSRGEWVLLASHRWEECCQELGLGRLPHSVEGNRHFVIKDNQLQALACIVPQQLRGNFTVNNTFCHKAEYMCEKYQMEAAVSKGACCSWGWDIT